jgi:hypothetical protein
MDAITEFKQTHPLAQLLRDAGGGRTRAGASGGLAPLGVSPLPPTYPPNSAAQAAVKTVWREPTDSSGR